MHWVPEQIPKIFIGIQKYTSDKVVSTSGVQSAELTSQEYFILFAEYKIMSGNKLYILKAF